MKHEYQVIIRQENGELISVICEEQETLLDAFFRNGIIYRADCGGRGACGKCRIKVIEGNLGITVQDRRVLSCEELEQGYRLACKAIPAGDVAVCLCNRAEETMKALTEHCEETEQPEYELQYNNRYEDKSEGYIIAIDLGTTTVAFRLSEVRNRSSLSTYTLVNPQRIYGADVISRIRASLEGRQNELQNLIQKSLHQGIQKVIEKAGIAPKTVMQIAIAGNTTMIHLLLGYSCETLGAYPFIPVNKNTQYIRLKELLFQQDETSMLMSMEEDKGRYLLQSIVECPVLILPGITTFVGGDILAGMAICGFHASETVNLLIDFGTNGEIALGNKDRILVTSTAAGPAFEGGNISCGTGSISGAICRFSIEGDAVDYETIDGAAPVGICGTGVIELVSELYRNGMIDETGLLCEKYFHSGYPIEYQGNTVFTCLQKDIRELQLAKAAIRAGIEILLRNYGIQYNEVEKIYLAGGFGFYLDVDKAVRIGLLPAEWKDKIIVVGNSSLAGAEQAARSSKYVILMERLAEKVQELHLSMDPSFSELFLEQISF